MVYYVYIIESQLDGDLYKGVTTNYLKRLEEHNSGRSKFTSCKMPWVIKYVEEFPTKKEALIREKQLKRQNRNLLPGCLQKISGTGRQVKKISALPDDILV